jgi:hypothetical protein
MALVPTTRLEAVNELLGSIGESPVNTDSNTGLVEADLAAARIDSTSRSLQKRGWHWNTLINYELVPDINGFIYVPASCLKVDTWGKDRHLDYVQRGNRLYDRENNTFNIGKTVVVEMVLFLPFNELPENARHYVTMSAARKFQERLFGSPELSGYDKDDETQAWFDLLDAESDTCDYNMLTDSLSVMQIINRKHFYKE